MKTAMPTGDVIAIVLMLLIIVMVLLDICLEDPVGIYDHDELTDGK